MPSSFNLKNTREVLNFGNIQGVLKNGCIRNVARLRVRVRVVV